MEGQHGFLVEVRFTAARNYKTREEALADRDRLLELASDCVFENDNGEFVTGNVDVIDADTYEKVYP